MTGALYIFSSALSFQGDVAPPDITFPLDASQHKSIYFTFIKQTISNFTFFSTNCREIIFTLHVQLSQARVLLCYAESLRHHDKALALALVTTNCSLLAK